MGTMAMTTTCSSRAIAAPAAGAAAESRALRACNVHCSSMRAAPRSVLAMATDYRRDGGAGGGGDFVTGFLLGGAVFGALGFLLAPQVKRSVAEVVDRDAVLLPKKSARLLDDDETGEGIEKTRENLSNKISQLNAAIDNVSAQLRQNEKVAA